MNSMVTHIEEIEFDFWIGQTPKLQWIAFQTQTIDIPELNVIYEPNIRECSLA